jgi:AraC-like DNA-binding protein
MTADVGSVGGYREFVPRVQERTWLEALWVHVAPAAPACTDHRVVADVAPSLCFQCSRDATGRPTTGRLLMIGPVWTPRRYRPAPGARMEAVRLKPEWCRALLGADPGEHGDSLDDFRGVDRAFGGRLLDRLSLTRTSGEALKLLAGAVKGRRADANPTTPLGLAHAALETVRTGPATPRLVEIAEDLGVTSRHLRRVVGEHAGSSPRRFARVQRFLRFLRDADAAPHPVWADLAATHGYADQAHLIRETRALSGVTPATLHAERIAED